MSRHRHSLGRRFTAGPPRPRRRKIKTVVFGARPLCSTARVFSSLDRRQLCSRESALDDSRERERERARARESERVSERESERERERSRKRGRESRRRSMEALASGCEGAQVAGSEVTTRGLAAALSARAEVGRVPRSRVRARASGVSPERRSPRAGRDFGAVCVRCAARVLLRRAHRGGFLGTRQRRDPSAPSPGSIIPNRSTRV